MGRKKKVVEVVDTAPQTTPEAPTAKMFEWADLVLDCKCGHRQTLGTGIQHGLQLNPLITREDSFIQFACTACGAEMILRFVEGVAPAETETVNESVQEESKQEQSV